MLKSLKIISKLLNANFFHNALNISYVKKYNEYNINVGSFQSTNLKFHVSATATYFKHVFKHRFSIIESCSETNLLLCVWLCDDKFDFD